MSVFVISELAVCRVDAEENDAVAITADKSRLAPVAKGWKVVELTLDANEGIAIGDIDNDGNVDVVSGRNWYPAPSFVPKPLRSIDDWNGYVESNGDFLFDLNGDGRLDVIAGSFIPTQVFWYENPGTEALRLGQQWKRHLLMDTKLSENEAQLMADMDGDSIPEWIVNSWNPKNPVMVYRLKPTESNLPGNRCYEVMPSMISDVGNHHGMGIGDLNNDHRIDLLTGAGWFEQPEHDAWSKHWKFHPDWAISGSIPMLVHDIDGDGKNDLIVGEGHDYGLYLWRQKGTASDGKLDFEKIVIDKTFSEPHALALVDIDNDGVLDLVSGKRYFAHNGGDPGGAEMPEVNYYRYLSKENRFEKFPIEQGHVGVGLQIGTADFNNNGKIDLAVPGKSGTYLLLQ